VTRVHALTLLVLLTTSCQQAAVKVEPPQAEYVVIESQRQRIPGWALQEIPEDTPRERSTTEAVALACRRLNIIRHANCLTGQLKRYDKGLKVEPLQCKLNLNEGCVP
jgi:hypothetical protein